MSLLPREIDAFPVIAGSMFLPLELGQNSVNTSISRSCCERGYVISKPKLKKEIGLQPVSLPLSLCFGTILEIEPPWGKNQAAKDRCDQLP